MGKRLYFAAKNEDAGDEVWSLLVTDQAIYLPSISSK
jgi:hypothetical protein